MENNQDRSSFRLSPKQLAVKSLGHTSYQSYNGTVLVQDLPVVQIARVVRTRRSHAVVRKVLDGLVLLDQPEVWP